MGGSAQSEGTVCAKKVGEEGSCCFRHGGLVAEGRVEVEVRGPVPRFTCESSE